MAPHIDFSDSMFNMCLAINSGNVSAPWLSRTPQVPGFHKKGLLIGSVAVLSGGSRSPLPNLAMCSSPTSHTYCAAPPKLNLEYAGGLSGEDSATCIPKTKGRCKIRPRVLVPRMSFLTEAPVWRRRCLPRFLYRSLRATACPNYRSLRPVFSHHVFLIQ
jgi:hypothetical protein